jgi:peptide/nickel transport system ATP-binding protein
VARMAQRVSVMYAGEVVETGTVAEIFAAPTHPYTRGLLDCIPVPGMTRNGEPLGNIPGVVPRLLPGFIGCGFRDRCTMATPECAETIPLRDVDGDHRYLCRLPPDWKRTAA